MKVQSFLFFLALSFGLFAQKSDDPVLMTIKGTPVYRSEFEYIYTKNNSQNTLDKKTLSEYVDLFVNFKIKVLEAESLGMDTTKSFLNELDGYRHQLTPPYLTDSAALTKYTTEAYDRLKTDIDVSHILIRISPNASPSDTLAAYNKIIAIRDRVTQSKVIVPDNQKKKKKPKTILMPPEDFQTVAKEVSEDPSTAQNSGHLGFITGFLTIYPFENVAYNTPVGQISQPVRTNYGYHLIKVNETRPTRGQVQVAHIMKFAQKGANDSIINKAKHVIDSAYQEVKNGADFSTVARRISDDKGSAANGGTLPWFGTGFMVKEFEDVSFSLKKGQFSEPFLSPYGWHIVKLLDTKPLEPFNQKKAEIERRIQRDDRGTLINQAFINRVKAEYHFTEAPANLDAYYQLAETSFPKDSIFKVKATRFSAPLFVIGSKQYTQKDFSSFLATNSNSSKSTAKEIVNEKYAQFVNNSLTNYEDAQLERKYSEFRNLVREYHDGILLFNISNQEVWEKATKDTKGLETYFQVNKSNYAWKEPRFKGVVIYCKNEQTHKKVQSLLKLVPKDSIDTYLASHLNKDTTFVVKVEKGLYGKGENKAVDKYRFNTGSFTPAHDFPVVFTEGKMLPLGPESYTDVKGAVTADYQTYLEDQWVRSLRKKYPVSINQAVLKTIKEN
jgi:peptidyl-prolyl cis-trans isomerase SurA